MLRRTLCGQEVDSCRCGTHSIPEVTDLEYDRLVGDLLASSDQAVVVCVCSGQREDEALAEVTRTYRERNRWRGMPCVQASV